MRSRPLFVVMILVAVATCLRLGVWQLDRLHQRRAANAALLGARALPPVALPGPRAPAQGLRVAARGEFDLGHQFVLRGRAWEGAPGVEVATPLHIEGSDTALLVLRGFVPSDDAMSVDLKPLDEPGPRTVHGIAFTLPAEADSGAPLVRNGSRTFGRLDLASVRAALPYPVYDVAVWQEKEPGMTGMPVRIGAPTLSDGPHLSYAIQWFAFAVIFGVGGVVYLRRMRDEKGETRAES